MNKTTAKTPEWIKQAQRERARALLLGRIQKGGPDALKAARLLARLEVSAALLAIESEVPATLTSPVFVRI